MSINYSLASVIMSDDIELVKVKFYNPFKEDWSGEYTYKTNETLMNGELVIVEAKDWYSVAQVVETNVLPEIESDKTYRWVVGKVQQMIDSLEYLKNQEKRAQDELKRLEMKNVRKSIVQSLGLSENDIPKLRF